ncbi:hypothetical protein JET14_13355 [Martelella lutilitoris]|uniref:Uncharacterized protein n=1 Tax=Martelella lutilitoris TaxID=2583532 RepID=A0A7T7HHJ0_9HYPH|nr:hypothetical protein [Martelella lutilitoris]QQM29311.1 hypothetical protein JET14_13355 [Martelella lutilitoris]
MRGDMTRDDIHALFITAAEVDRRLPDTARPARLKAQSLETVHTREDMNGWGTERLSEERKAFWEGLRDRIGAEQMTAYEKALEMIAICPEESHRRALWAWARAKAGGKPFARWCRSEGISRTAGCNRKDRAVAFLAAQVGGSAAYPTQVDGFDGFTDAPEINDIEPTIATGMRAWNDGDLPREPQPEARSFSWAEKQNKMRRARAEKRAREQATA